ncbi:hypothetical protein G6O67_006742 [Ophiocordyceps sinensis]|uniref:Uncharacterized protein n=1 Tax=Ophiocordyceps sinensis TaxID=72228 RepID=A0A8H4LWA5_9HYPO|nr:hypothetical protein G6O67_006742 [Ophiocordyceps sinensis]
MEKRHTILGFQYHAGSPLSPAALAAAAMIAVVALAAAPPPALRPGATGTRLRRTNRRDNAGWGLVTGHCGRGRPSGGSPAWSLPWG